MIVRIDKDRLIVTKLKTKKLSREIVIPMELISIIVIVSPLIQKITLKIAFQTIQRILSYPAMLHLVYYVWDFYGERLAGSGSFALFLYATVKLIEL